MISNFTSKIQLTDVPDNAQYSVLDDTGRLVAESETNQITATAVPAGSQIRVDYDVGDLGPGNYTVVFEIGSREYNVPYVVAESTRDPDGYISLNGNIDLAVPTDSGTWTLYDGNISVANGIFTGSHLLISTGLAAGWDSRLLVIQDSTGAIADYEVFVLNATMLKAITEVRAQVDRLQRTLRLDALEFEDVDYLRALARARDRFNTIPLATQVTMLNATGPIRGAWLTLATVEVCRTRGLEEGLSAIDYQGSSVQLNVNTVQALSDYLNLQEQRVTEEIQPLKTDLHTRSQTGGDGNYQLRSKFVGASGRTLGPATGRGCNLYGGRNRLVYR